ncbi:hypothetical protein FACS1894187_19830 [Synergistales bacterium]|nr:hypothetical protein FACS1894187_19830 [Synergistales bacterium]
MSDIFSNMSGGKISGDWSHPELYCRRNPASWRRENFADIFELIASNNTEGLEFVRSFFPQTVATVEKELANL